MEITNSSSLIEIFYALNEAKASVNRLESNFKNGAVSPNGPSAIEIEKIKNELSDLTNMLMSLQEKGSKDLFEVEHKTLSILSTTDAYCKLLEALTEVLKNLRENEKQFRNKESQNKEREKLIEQGNEIRNNLKLLLDLVSENNNHDYYKIKKEITEVESLKKYIFNNFGIEIKLNTTVNTIV